MWYATLLSNMQNNYYARRVFSLMKNSIFHLTRCGFNYTIPARNLLAGCGPVVYTYTCWYFVWFSRYFSYSALSRVHTTNIALTCSIRLVDHWLNNSSSSINEPESKAKKIVKFLTQTDEYEFKRIHRHRLRSRGTFRQFANVFFWYAKNCTFV